MAPFNGRRNEPERLNGYTINKGVGISNILDLDLAVEIQLLSSTLNQFIYDKSVVPAGPLTTDFMRVLTSLETLKRYFGAR